MRLLTAIVILLGLATEALAQEPAPPPKESAQTPVVERQVKARAGRAVRLLTITNVRPDCSSGPMPTVRLEIPPKHGKIAMQRIRYTATNRRECLAAEVPALVALYQSSAEFEGSDSVT